MRRKKNFTEKAVVLLQKFTRFTKEQKWFIIYLAVLSFFLVLFPIVKVSALWEIDAYSVWLLSGTYFKTALFIFVSLLIMIGWNTSFRLKNLMIRYLGFRNDDNLINFFLLWIIVVAFFWVTDTLGVVDGITSRITLSFWAKLIQVILLLGLIFNLWSVLKAAKDNGKKAKIITMQDENHNHHNHELNEQEKKQLKGLFDDK